MKFTIFNTLLFLLCISLLGACSSTTQVKSNLSASGVTITKTTYRGDVRTRLSKHFNSWKAVPYKMGGISKRGIDCSGFALTTYRDVFGINVPHSTKLLSETGKSVSLNQIKIGDLLVFKTGIIQKHVGVFIGDGQFIHASSSKGVMTSNINAAYWSDKYRQTRRIIAP